MSTLKVVTLSELLEMKFDDDAITEHSPMYVPLTNNYISRYRKIRNEREGELAVYHFLKMLKFFAEPLQELDPKNPSHLEWAVGCIQDINHLCVKYAHVMREFGLDRMLFEVKRKDDKANPPVST